MRLAVFDIDGTLTTGASTERRFYWHLLRTGNQGPQQLLAASGFLARWAPVFGHHVFKKNKAYLTGLDEREVSLLAMDWASVCLPAIWFEPCRLRLRAHQRQGDRVVLLSGTPHFIAAAVAAAMGVEEFIGSSCCTRQGRFCAAPPSRHPFGFDKVTIARELCARSGSQAEDVIAYADSIHDRELLSWAGTAVAVRPDSRLSRLSRQRGWEILGRRGVGKYGWGRYSTTSR